MSSHATEYAATCQFYEYRLKDSTVHNYVSALGVSAIMRYINRRFTYLLTYLLTYLPSVCVKSCSMYAQTVCPSHKIWCTNTAELACFFGVSHPCFKGRAPSVPKFFWTILHVHTQYKKQQTNLAQ